MRIAWDAEKSRILRANPARGIGFEDAQNLFNGDYATELCCDDPEQFLAIGWVAGKLYSVIFEVREGREGEYYWLVTLWPSTAREERFYAEHT